MSLLIGAGDEDYGLLLHKKEVEPVEKGKLTGCDYHRGLDLVVVGFSNGVYALYQMPFLSAFTCDQFHNTGVYNDMGNRLTFDSQLLATGADDNKIKVWTVSSGFCFVTFSEHTNAVVTPTPKQFVSLAADSIKLGIGASALQLQLPSILRLALRMVNMENIVNLRAIVGLSGWLPGARDGDLSTKLGSEKASSVGNQFFNMAAYWVSCHFNHVSREVKSLETSTEFYEKILGFGWVKRPRQNSLHFKGVLNVDAAKKALKEMGVSLLRQTLDVHGVIVDQFVELEL
ncbi:hypothetical protein SASPL_101943 [Salvia splendens]|uniref:Uncharacterized protein n=1 Tax=Salvia splendens TaxID=180675 RepID=A0A8X9ADP4_SALSN|nr:hypothetical protein SASPL_101943 [Salvia splendens]